MLDSIAPEWGVILGAGIMRLPIFLVWIGAAILAVSRTNRHRTASILLIIGAGLLTLVDLALPPLQVSLPMGMREQGATLRTVTILTSSMTILSSILHAIGYGLVAGAVFADRSEPRRTTPA